ncbi:MAG: hypothetical protein LBI28_04595 [Treponema sp.]|jgi:hypothetical protein|nr:hypothetical protein [Treponema sp.]
MDKIELFEIKEGYDYGSTFWFLGRYDEKSKVHDMFCIEEEYVRDYLLPFIDKITKESFDYLDSKYFSKEMVYNLCNDIQNISNVIQSNFNDPILDELKENFSIFYIASDDEQKENDFMNMTKGEIMKFIEKNKERIIDFYKCFLERIKKLVDNMDDNKGIYISSP